MSVCEDCVYWQKLNVTPRIGLGECAYEPKKIYRDCSDASCSKFINKEMIVKEIKCSMCGNLYSELNIKEG